MTAARLAEAARTVPDLEVLLAAGRAAGLDAVGACSAEPFEGTRAQIEARTEAGHAAGMAFTFRDPERATTPSRLLPGARAIVVGALGYLEQPPSRRPAVAARVARYAWRDHHARLMAGLQAVSRLLRAAGWRTRVVSDDNGLVDRAAAHRAGIGWYGKSSNLLLPGRGSWFILGAVVTDAPVEAAPEPVPDGCGTCRRCLDGCPTGAIVTPGVVDARRCLSWLLQAPGTFPVQHREALGDRIYGCDECQEVCPPNRRLRPGGPHPGAVAWLDPRELLELDDAALLERCGRWYIAGRDPNIVRRNALVVLGNGGRAGDPRTEAVLETNLTSQDPLLRAHAVWAARRLGCTHLLALVAGDTHPEVRAELQRGDDGRP